MEKNFKILYNNIKVNETYLEVLVCNLTRLIRCTKISKEFIDGKILETDNTNINYDKCETGLGCLKVGEYNCFTKKNILYNHGRLLLTEKI